jgi:hypothetical protein
MEVEVTVPVRHLQRGDYLLGSKRTVVSVGYSPMTGTRAVVLKNGDDVAAKENAYTAIWRASTTMKVRRKQ